MQTEMIKDLRETIENHHASDEKKDQIISNLQAEISYLKARLFGASSEKRPKEDLPGQMSLFDEFIEEEPAREIEPEYIEIKAHERKRKKIGNSWEQRSQELPWQGGSSTVPKHTFGQCMIILRNS